MPLFNVHSQFLISTFFREVNTLKESKAVSVSQREKCKSFQIFIRTMLMNCVTGFNVRYNLHVLQKTLYWWISLFKFTSLVSHYPPYNYFHFCFIHFSRFLAAGKFSLLAKNRNASLLHKEKFALSLICGRLRAHIRRNCFISFKNKFPL